MRFIRALSMIMAALIAGDLPAQQGLMGEYYNGSNFETKVLTRTDQAIRFNWDMVSPAAGMNTTDYSIRWTGKLLAPKSGKYVFSAKVDDGIRVWVGGQKIIDAWGLHDSEDFSGAVTLEAKKHYDLKVEYFNGIFEGEITLLWVMPGEGNALLDLFSSPAKPVDAKYFSQPVASKPASPTPKPEAKPAQKTPPPKKTPPAKPKQTPAKIPQPVADPPKKTSLAAAPPEVKAKQHELELKYIYFVKSKDIILPESQRTLDDWATFLQQQTNATIEIAGHTDDLGNAEKNQVLSEQRAQLVADYLIAQGLDKNRIRTKGYGETKPIFVNPATEKDRALNRRVEIRAK